MDSWIRFNETSLPDKDFYSNLNMEDITDVDYKHAKKVWKNFEIKNIGYCHDLYIQSDTLLLVDVFENIWYQCTEIYELDPGHFLPASGLAWQGCLKKTKIKLELLTNTAISLMVEQWIRWGICHAIHRYATANN